MPWIVSLVLRCLYWSSSCRAFLHLMCFICSQPYKMGLAQPSLFLPEANFALRILPLPAPISVCVRRSPSLFTITPHPFKPGSPNLDHKWKLHRLRCPWFCGVTIVTFKVKLNLKSRHLVSPQQEIRDHHITTREPWVPGLLYGPDCFMITHLCTYVYATTISRSRLFHSINLLRTYSHMIIEIWVLWNYSFYHHIIDTRKMRCITQLYSAWISNVTYCSMYPIFFYICKHFFLFYLLQTCNIH